MGKGGHLLFLLKKKVIILFSKSGYKVLSNIAQPDKKVKKD